MTNMKAIVATAYGSPDVLQLKTVAKPIPGDQEVLVKVVNSAATTADTMMRSGKPYFARLFLGLTKPGSPIPGTGFAGIVEEVGKEVTAFQPGDRVFGETAFGFSANAEYLKMSVDGVILPLPDTLDFSAAANFCDGHVTSYNFLHEIAGLQPGQRILIIGASGALGTSAVQIAKHIGAEISTVCSAGNAALVKSLGADTVIDYRTTDYTSGEVRYDFVYDAVGKSSFSRCRSILKEKGVYLSPVLSMRLLFQVLSTSVLRGKQAKFAATGTLPPATLRTMLQAVVDLYRKGALKTVIDRQYPLEKLVDAHRYIETGRKKGNVVIYTA